MILTGINYDITKNETIVNYERKGKMNSIAFPGLIVDCKEVYNKFRTFKRIIKRHEKN